MTILTTRRLAIRIRRRRVLLVLSAIRRLLLTVRSSSLRRLSVRGSLLVVSSLWLAAILGSLVVSLRRLSVLPLLSILSRRSSGWGRSVLRLVAGRW